MESQVVDDFKLMVARKYGLFDDDVAHGCLMSTIEAQDSWLYSSYNTLTWISCCGVIENR